MELKERILSYLQLDEQLEVIGLVEDELDEIVARIYNKGNLETKQVMAGNATLIKRIKSGYLAETDDKERFFIPFNSYKGESEEPGTRLICAKIKERKGRKTSWDAMECINYEELRYRLFSYIEDHDMVRASSVAWAIYKDATEDDRKAMKLCIHTLRDYLRDLPTNMAA